MHQFPFRSRYNYYLIIWKIIHAFNSWKSIWIIGQNVSKCIKIWQSNRHRQNRQFFRLTLCLCSWGMFISIATYQQMRHWHVRPLGKNEWVSWCQNSYHNSLDWLVKAGRTSWHLLSGRNEEKPISHNLSVEDATKMALDKPLRMLLAASEGIHWKGASRTMLIYQDTYQHWGTDLEEICTRCWYKQKIWHFNAHFGKKNARFHRVLCVSMWFFSSHTSIWQ